VQLEGAMTPLATFLWGSLITVSDARGGLVGP
jgi:hypothetical protein